MIRVLCVEDHRLVRDGIALIVGGQPDMAVIAAAATGEEGVRLYREHRPEVTLMDLQLPTMSGLEAITEIKRGDRDARIIVLTVYEGDEDIYRALQAGATTYLLKDTVSDDLIDVIREVYAGKRPITPTVLARLVERESRPVLTNREVQVLELVAEGMRNKEIAGTLGITDETAYGHLKNILAKFNVHDRTAAVREAVRRGILHLK
jgi:DNA-binding NarL/FixJ family response regulator